LARKLSGQPREPKKWLDLAEIWYTCFLDEYLVLSFSFFEIFISFFPVQIGPKTYGQPREPKNGWIVMAECHVKPSVAKN